MAACSFGRSHGPILTTLFPSVSLTTLHSPPHSILSLQSLHHSTTLPHSSTHPTNPHVPRTNTIPHLREVQHPRIPLSIPAPSGLLEVPSRPCTPSVTRAPINGVPIFEPLEELPSSGEDTECPEVPRAAPRPSSKPTQQTESSDARTL